MEIRRYTYANVFYNKGQSRKAKKAGAKLIESGYELMDRDSGGGHDKKTGKGFDYVDQYLKDHKSRTL